MIIGDNNSNELELIDIICEKGLDGIDCSESVTTYRGEGVSVSVVTSF